MWERGAYGLRGGKARRVGGKATLDECGEHFGCSGVIPGELEVQSLGKGLSSILTGEEAERSMLSGLDFLFAPKAEPGFWAVPIGVAQEVGSGQFHPNQRHIQVHIRIHTHIRSMRLMVSTTRAQWGGGLIGHEYQNICQRKSLLLLTVGDCCGKDGRAARAVKTDALCDVWEVIWKIACGTVKKK